jgi:hypothetical protein
MLDGLRKVMLMDQLVLIYLMHTIVVYSKKKLDLEQILYDI